MLTQDFAYLVKKFGKPQNAAELSAEACESYRGMLPDSLIDFWRELGVGSWLNGKFQFCRPEVYQPVVAAVCGQDEEFVAERSHAFGYTAFGELFIWNEAHGRLQVSLPQLMAEADKLSASAKKLPPERQIATGLFLLDHDSHDFVENTRAAPLLFARALKQLGELQAGECYGFVPALGIGGAARLENLKRMPALEHFMLLAQLGRPRLMDYGGGRERFVRVIG